MTLPAHLQQLQHWFGQLISAPLEDGHISPYTPDGQCVAEEASLYLSPCCTLTPYEGLEIYNQHYWWRLFQSLQGIFPTLTRLFGIEAFTVEIATPYLIAHMPNHWSMTDTGDYLPQWIEQFYSQEDKKFISQCAAIDLAYQRNIRMSSQKTFIPTLSESDFRMVLSLQPHLSLFKLSWDLFPWRKRLIQQLPSYWLEHPLPEPLPAVSYSALYRTMDNQMHYQKLSKSEFLILEKLAQGITLNGLCEWLEKSRISAQQLDQWMRQWINRQWIVQIPEKPPT